LLLHIAHQICENQIDCSEELKSLSAVLASNDDIKFNRECLSFIVTNSSESDSSQRSLVIPALCFEPFITAFAKHKTLLEAAETVYYPGTSHQDSSTNNNGESDFYEDELEFFARKMYCSPNELTDAKENRGL
jgi:hypothetical protein